MGSVRCPVLIGRAEEIAAGDAALAAARVSGGSVVSVVGEAGVGKSRLIAEFTKMARLRGFGVLVGRGSAESAGVPLCPWSDARVPATRRLGWPSDAGLAPYRGVLGLLVPDWREPGWVAPSEAPAVLGEAILRCLGYLAADGGLMVVLEDLHWADERTLHTLNFVIDHIAELSVVLVVTMRDEAVGPRVAALVRRSGARDNDRARAEIHLAHAEHLAPDDTDLRAGVWAIGHGIGALIDDERPRARRAFATAKSLAPERHARILDAALGPNLVLDAIDDATSPTEIELAKHGEVNGARWSNLWLGTALGIALARQGEHEHAERELFAALQAGERYPLFSALCRRLAADTAITTGFTDPVALLRDASTAFGQLELFRAAESVRGHLRSLGANAPRQRHGRRVDASLDRVGVTPREAEVLALLADRRTNKEIAGELYVSAKTVEKHVASLAMKFNAANRGVLSDIARTRRDHSRGGLVGNQNG